MTDVDVIYIGGSGRSGSTLLHRIVGAADQRVAIGELTNIWEYHFVRKNQLCGCGKPFDDCAFWSAVMDEAFGGIEAVDAQRMLSLWQSTQRRSHLPMLAFPALRTTAFERRLREYAETLSAIYRAIQVVSGCSVIVDASKRPQHAFALAEVPGIRPKMIHLVRDSRGCAYSWQKRNKRNAAKLSADWVASQSFNWLAGRRFGTYALCRYEDFAAEPRRALKDLETRLALTDQRESPFVSDDAVELSSDHSLWGNPNRFERGVVSIRLDDEWRRQMPGSQRAIVTALTFPLLWKYGYLIGSRSSSGQHVGVEPVRQ